MLFIFTVLCGHYSPFSRLLLKIYTRVTGEACLPKLASLSEKKIDSSAVLALCVFIVLRST